MPVQAYFRMNSEGMGQFEHTLIVAEKGSEVHYIEGCSAPKYNVINLHSGGVEVFVKEDAHVQYSTVQNWSKNTFNLNTKRAIVESGGRMEWVSGSMGSKATMLYPCSILKGRGASANHNRQNHPAIVVAESDEAVVKKVESTPGSVGLVDVYAITGGVTVVRVGSKLPLEPGYVLHGN